MSVASAIGVAPTAAQIAATVLLAVAVMHTFSTRLFERLAHINPAHSGLWHLLGEVETVFGLWAFILLVFMAAVAGWKAATGYLEASRFVEPMFVFVVMVISASRPILGLASAIARTVAAAASASCRSTRSSTPDASRS